MESLSHEAIVEPMIYQITVRGRASARVMSILEPLLPEDGSTGGQTSFVGDIIDRSHLYGVLSCLERHDVELVSIVPVGRTAQPSRREVSA